MNFKTATASLLVATGVSVGAYSFWESSPAAATVDPVARELEVEESPMAARRQLFLSGGDDCTDFGSCCEDIPTRRLAGSFDADVAHGHGRQLASCQTAWARMDMGQNCFLFASENVPVNRWGWRLEMDASVSGRKDFEVFGGAGQCDTSKGFGTSIGVFTLSYDVVTQICSGDFVANTGYSATQIHFYCGKDPYPIKNGVNTVAPGQFPCNLGSEGDPKYATMETCKYQVPSGGTINALAHFNGCDSPGSGPGPSPGVDVCDVTSGAICQDPTEFCASKSLELCGTSCCPIGGGLPVYEVEAQCATDGKTWCPKDCDDGDVFGDPHFRTWHMNHEFEYHGECDIVFLKAPAMDMDIHVRTTIRYDYSFVSQAAVRIGSEIFEVASWGEYQLDGMSSIDLPAFIGGFPITRTELAHGKQLKVKFTIHLEQDKEIVLTSFKDYVSVKIENGNVAMYEGSSGILGDYETGSMYMRDGTIETDPNKYAPEWQVRPKEDGVLFAGDRAPVYPQKCVMPNANAISARDRRLGEASVSKEQAKAACAHKNHEDRDDCIVDVLKTQDLDIANA